MIFFTENDKNNLLKKINRYKKILFAIIVIFVILTIIPLLTINYLTETFSLVLEIIFSSLFFCYIILYIKQLMHVKNILDLYRILNLKETTYNCVIKNLSGEQTLNKLLFKKIIVTIENEDKIFYLYNQIKLDFYVGDRVNLIVSKNYIKGWFNDEKITS